MFVMTTNLFASIAILFSGLAGAAGAESPPSPQKKLNNLVSELLEVSSISRSSEPFRFTHPNDGWIFISAKGKGQETATVILDKELPGDRLMVHEVESPAPGEAMRFVTKGEHNIQVEYEGNATVDRLVVRAIPELVHCGLELNPEIKSYGRYDIEFLKGDILPNVTTLIVPGSIKLSRSVMEDWHRQGKWFVAEAGINSQARTVEDHFKFWTGFYDQAPILDCGYRIALERYLHEMSREQGSRDALQALLDGIADWEAKEPGVKRQMVIAFGLFSMPPGSINKQPNVDYHVWMDQQMNLVANHPALSGIGGLEWWTSTLADEETVRFVGKLYRHYALEGKTEMLTRDPLFLTHVQNADFEHGTEGWTLHSAEEGSMAAKSFPRYGRIEGRYLGLGRPPDPEHIGDTFLWMKRSGKGPNTCSQTIKDLEPGRLYSMKMFSCDYQDLMNPKAKKLEEATPFLGSVELEEVEVDAKRSFREMYASNPEPRIPVWITYHWKVFRAKSTTGKLILSDWQKAIEPGAVFGQEQIFNFLEIQPYRE